MASVKFGAGEIPVAAVAVAESAPEAALAPAQSQCSVPATYSEDPLPGPNEIILPRIQLVQNIGDLAGIFEHGSILFDKRLTLYIPSIVDKNTGNVTRQGTPPLSITVLRFKPTSYVEKTAGGVRGAWVNTEEEVRAAGGTLDYKEWKLKEASGMKRFEPLADALCAIERPESVADDDTVFIHSVNGKKYALAFWAMRGVVYTEGAKRVFFTQRHTGCLREGYPVWSYAITTREKIYDNGHRAWVPVCVPKAKSTPEFLAFAQGVLNPPSERVEQPAF